MVTGQKHYKGSEVADKESKLGGGFGWGGGGGFSWGGGWGGEGNKMSRLYLPPKPLPKNMLKISSASKPSPPKPWAAGPRRCPLTPAPS